MRSAFRAEALLRELLPLVVGGIALFGAITIPARSVADIPVTFEDVTAKLKVQFKQEHSPTSNKYLVETMGGGVALLDYDNDGRLDIFFTNGARLSDPMPPGALPDKSDPKYWNRLWHQNADGTFTDVTGKAGVSGNPTAGYSMGVAVGDYDNDGFEDILVTGYAGNVLYHNNGDGTFTDVTAKAGVRGSGWSVSAGFFDYDNDGHLDIFVTRYLDWTFETNIYCGDRVPGYRAYCHPNNFPAVSSLLYRNNGDGTFTGCFQGVGHSGRKREIARRGIRRLRWRWPDGRLRRQRFRAVFSISQQRQWNIHGNRIDLRREFEPGRQDICGNGH